MRNKNEINILKQSLIKNLEAGSSIEGACKKSKISKKTFYEFFKEDKEFADAVQKAKLSQIIVAEDMLYKKMQEGNMIAIIFYLCNRSPDRWKNVQRVETQHSGELEVNFSLNELSKRYINANSRKEDTDKGRNK